MIHNYNFLYCSLDFNNPDSICKRKKLIIYKANEYIMIPMHFNAMLVNEWIMMRALIISSGC